MQNIATFKPLTNRATTRGGKFTLPDDGFVMLVPKGEAPNVMDDGSKEGKRIIQVVDDAALTSIMHKLLNRGGEMLMDTDHHSHELDKTTEANGWQPLEADLLQNRADGLYGDPRWSTKGLANVEGGVLRFISPEFGTSNLQPLGGDRYRVTEVTGLALTNRPGFKRLQKPLTNRDADDGIEEKANTNTMHKAALAAHLGITESDIDKLDESTLKNRLQSIKVQAAKAESATTELNTLKNREADEFLKLHERVIPANDDLKKDLREIFLKNRETAQVMVDGFTAAGGKELTAEQKARAEKKPLFNRETAKGPPDADAQKAADTARASKVSGRAQELCNREKGLSWSAAFRRADAEIPAA